MSGAADRFVATCRRVVLRRTEAAGGVGQSGPLGARGVPRGADGQARAVLERSAGGDDRLHAVADRLRLGTVALEAAHLKVLADALGTTTDQLYEEAE